MRRSLLTALAAAVALGCSPAATAVSSREPSRSLALELAWSIEGHATECTVVRPTALPDARRSLLARYRAHAERAYAVPEEPTAPRVTAYVRCVVGDEAGSRAVTRMSFSRPLEPADRETLRGELPGDVRWLESPCAGGACGLRTAAFVAPDRLELTEVQLVGTDASSPDVRRAIAASIASRPTLVEVTALHVSGTRADVLEGLESAPRGLLVTQRIEGRDDFALVDSEAIDRALARLAWPGEDAALGFRVRGEGFERELPLSWAQIEVAVADRRIADRARLRRASRDRVVPLTEIDLDQPRAVSRQAGARAIAARVTRDPERVRRLEDERVTLLARLFELTQDAEAIVAAIELLIERGELDRARTLAFAAAEVARDRVEVRDALVRAVAADPGLLEAAIASLRPDLSQAERALLVSAVGRAAPDGVGWRTVEQSFSVHRVAAAPAVHAAERVTLPVGALAELGYLLLRAQGATGPFAVGVRGTLREGAPEHVELLAVRWPEQRGLSRWVSVPSEAPSLDRLRWISSALWAQLPARGEVEMTALAGRQSLTLRLHIEGGTAELLGASTSLPRGAWPALARDVARPVAALDGTRFPLPVLRLALQPATLRAVAPRLTSPDGGGALAGGRCVVEADQLVCTGTERGPEALLDALVVVTEEALRR